MFPYLSLGPFLLQTPGLAVLIGVWSGLTLVEKESVLQKLNKEHVYNLVMYGLITGIIGARLAYAVRFLSIYLDDPLSLFALNPNTLAPSDGLVIGALFAVIYGRRKELTLRPTLDALAPGLAVFLVSLGVAHFLSGDAFGAPTDLPWAITLWDEKRHPTQIYETLLALGILFIVWKRPLNRQGTGLNFLLTVSLSAASRLFMEAFRGNSVIWLGGFRAAQIVSLMILLISLWLIPKWVKNPKSQNESQVI